jgi:hypothetical protein
MNITHLCIIPHSNQQVIADCIIYTVAAITGLITNYTYGAHTDNIRQFIKSHNVCAYIMKNTIDIRGGLYENKYDLNMKAELIIYSPSISKHR